MSFVVRKNKIHQKKFGQNFLVDSEVIQKISDCAQKLAQEISADTILEIGPGQGALTAPILQWLEPSQNFILIEKDRGLAQHWKEVLTPPKIVFEKDALHWSPNEISFIYKNILLISNLPYSVGTAILRHFHNLMELGFPIQKILVMVQKEVGDRFLAKSGKNRGSLSVFFQNHWDIQEVLKVPPEAFRPKPNVHSSVILLTKRQKPRILIPDLKTWEALLHLCFQQKRKTLLSNLRSTWSKDRIEKAQSLGLDFRKRAEELSWEDWSFLVQLVSS